MGLFSWFKYAEKRYPLGALGVLIGLVGIALGIYVGRHERKPNILFEVLSEANVLDIHTALPELTILFRGEDVQKASLNLRVIRVRVSNSGESDIAQSLYDNNEPWGFKVRGGRAIEVRVVDATSDYLRTWVMPQRINDST